MLVMGSKATTSLSVLWAFWECYAALLLMSMGRIGQYDAMR